MTNGDILIIIAILVVGFKPGIMEQLNRIRKYIRNQVNKLRQ